MDTVRMTGTAALALPVASEFYASSALLKLAPKMGGQKEKSMPTQLDKGAGRGR